MRWLIVVCVVLSSSLAFADKVRLKSGEEYDGRMLDKNDEFVIWKTEGAPVYLPASQIESVTKEEKVGSNTVSISCDFGPSICKHFVCSFRQPLDFGIVEDSPQQILLVNSDKKMSIKIIPLTPSEPLHDENIGFFGAKMVAGSLGKDIVEMKDIDTIVKKFGERQVSGRKAVWFYYPEPNNKYLIHRTFVSTINWTGFMVELDIYPQPNDQYAEQGDKIANEFLDGFTF